MTISVGHVLTATTPDDPAYEIKPSNWNSGHAITLNIGGTDISGAFANSNNITFGLAPGGAITASASYSQSVFNQTIQTQNSVQLQGSSGSIVFANSNGITFGGAGSVITASYNSTSFNTSGLGGAAISALGSSQNTGTVVFSNSNGVSFGMSGSVITVTITAQAPVTAGVSGISISDTSYSSGVINFVNSNGISFGASGANGISASYTVPSTANLAGTVFSTVSRTGSFAAGTMNTGGLTLGIPSYITTYSNLGAGTGFTGTNATGTLNSNGLAISVGVGSAAGTAGIYGQGNTTGQNSSATYNLSSLPIVGGGVISVGNSAGSLQISGPGTAVLSQMSVGINGGNTAGNSGTVAQGQVVFAGGNNVTLSGSTNGSNMTITVSAGSLAAAPVNFSAGTTSNNLATIVFSNSNNVSFGLNGSTITGSVSGGGGGIFAGVSNIGNFGGSTGTVSTGNVVFAGYGGMTLSQSTGAAGSAATISISAPTVSSLVGGANVTVSSSGSTISIIAANAAPAPVNFSAGTTSNNLGTVVFSNSNNMSFGLNGSTITGSYTVPNTAILAGTNLVTTTQAGSTLGATLNTSGLSLAIPQWLTVAAGGGAAISAAGSSQNTGTVVFSNANGVSFGMNGATITASAVGGTGGGIGLSAGSVSQSAGNIIFSNSNNVSFGMNGSTVTGSIPAFAGTNFATTSAAGSMAAATMNTSGMTLAMPAYLTTYSSIPSFSGGISFLGNNAGTTGTVASQIVLVGSGIVSLSQAVSGGSATISILAPATSSLSASGAINIVSNGSTISIGAPAQSAQPVAASGSNGSFAFSTLSFGNANYISFQTSNGSIIATGGYVKQGFSTAGTLGSFTGTADSNGLSIAMPTMTRFAMNSQLSYNTLATLNASASNGIATYNYLQLANYLFGTRMDGIINWVGATTNNGNSVAPLFSVWMGIYSRNASTLSAITTASTTTSYPYASNTGNATWISVAANRPLSAPINFTLPPGEYYIGYNVSTGMVTSGTYTSLGQSISHIVLTSTPNYAEMGVAVANSSNWCYGAGVATVAAALPATVAISNLTSPVWASNLILFRD